ncbi:carbohydrate ABC transporter permease [Neorhizobium sp. DT-125]|uniref:carbohydrate ABC transporter permease n=1 Tax=Neorhizobium sp. DT-125 TaxID=3396163 RepID=UPI003F19748D
MTTPETRIRSVRMGEGPSGPAPKSLSPARIGIYAFLVISALFFLLPLYVMVVTSIKPMEEIRLGGLFALPTTVTFEPWVKAWSSACTGLDCRGISPGFWNSVKILVPSVICSIFVGALTGYALSFWRARGANLLFAALLLGAFLPYQVFIYPLVRIYSATGLFSTIYALVLTHVIFGLPVMTLLFRNYYAGIPIDLFKAARVDGGRFFSIFFRLMLPMSIPMLVVAVILQVTGIWNDFIMGLTFGGLANRPMTVQLTNLVAPTEGEIAYNVNMAATIMTAAVPLVVYFISGRWFVRGIAAGAVKG